MDKKNRKDMTVRVHDVSFVDTTTTTSSRENQIIVFTQVNNYKQLKRGLITIFNNRKSMMATEDMCALVNRKEVKVLVKGSFPLIE